MSNFEIRSSIVLDREVSLGSISIRSSRREDEYAYSNNGTLIYPIGIAVPVIRRGTGCIGVGVISEVILTATTTKITFTFNDQISESDKRAFYSLYRNQVSMEGGVNRDIYDASEDVVIPGAIGSININSSEPKPRKGRGQKASFNYYPDDEDDEDDYPIDPFDAFR